MTDVTRHCVDTFAVRSGIEYVETMKRNEGKSRTCGECANFVGSPFNEGYGICVIEDAQGRVSGIEFTEDATRCFTGSFEEPS